MLQQQPQQQPQQQLFQAAPAAPPSLPTDQKGMEILSMLHKAAAPAGSYTQAEQLAQSMAGGRLHVQRFPGGGQQQQPLTQPLLPAPTHPPTRQLQVPQHLPPSHPPQPQQPPQPSRPQPQSRPDQAPQQ